MNRHDLDLIAIGEKAGYEKGQREAAARIEALEAENARFRKALEFYADDYPFGNEAREALGDVA